ncbi:MAG: hypothetical protein IKR47_04400 [Lachnospiraceae bacterium]|nr:hypothetical protein [Lachnospiraceae bacterium]
MATKAATTTKKGTTGTKKTTAAKKTTTSASSVKLTATEKKLVELYRAADADTKKSAMAILKGEKEDMGDLLSTLMNNKTVKSVISGMLKK